MAANEINLCTYLIRHKCKELANFLTEGFQNQLTFGDNAFCQTYVLLEC